MTYDEVREALCIRYAGWTFDTVDNMTFDQIEIAWNRGKKAKGLAVNSDEDVERINREWRRYVGF